MASTAPDTTSPMARLHEIAERIDMTVEELLVFLDSPAGRRVRRVVAAGLIISVPLVMRIPGLRRSPIGRVVELVGGSALVFKLAEAIRDWEHTQPSHRPGGPVVDVPPAS
jgi:hypothetical protein